jgi:hypothetical protein
VNNRIGQLLFLSILTLTKALPQTFTDGPSVVANGDHRLEIFARASDGSVWRNWQTSPGGAWNGWSPMGGIIFGAPAATINGDGRLEVFVLGEANTLSITIGRPRPAADGRVGSPWVEASPRHQQWPQTRTVAFNSSLRGRIMRGGRLGRRLQGITGVAGVRLAAGFPAHRQQRKT